MNTKNLTTKLFTIKCENQRGMLSRILSVLERPGFAIANVSQSSTDIMDLSLVMVEVKIPAEKIETCSKQIERIAGVVDLVVSFGEFSRIGYFRFSAAALSAAFWHNIQLQGGQLVNWSDGSLLISKQGSLKQLEAFYNLVEGPSLLGFVQQPLPINEHGLIGDDF